MHRRLRTILAAFGAAMTVACTGQISSPGEPPLAEDPAVAAPAPGSSSNPAAAAAVPMAPTGRVADQPYQVPFRPLPRLGRREYDNTIRDLLGDGSAPAGAFPRDPAGPSGYEEPAAIGGLEAELYQSAAEAVAARAVARIGSLFPCAARTPIDEPGCASQIVQTLGPRAFRRPLRSEETSDLLGVFNDARQNLKLSFAASVGVVLQAVLQAPSFLYHREIGPDRAVVEGNAVRLTAYELASKLSYFLTGTMPDDALLAAAASGALLTPQGLAAQAGRVAANASALGETFVDFAREWLDLDPTSLEKSKDLFPGFAALRPQLWAEAKQSLGDVVSGGLGVEALLTDRSVYVSGATAALYGLPAPTSKSMVKMPANAAQRAGVLTQLSFLAVHATAAASHPVRRGKAVWADLLCGPMPPPPPNVPDVGPPLPNQTTRARFAMHDQNPCASCHRLMDPLGFAFEGYDAVGAFRTTEAGQPIDATGSATLPSGATVSFDGAVDLMTQLVRTSDVTTCLARQLARYGTATVDGQDEPIGREILQLAGSSRRITDLLLSVVDTRAFRYRKLMTGEVL